MVRPHSRLHNMAAILSAGVETISQSFSDKGPRKWLRKLRVAVRGCAWLRVAARGCAWLRVAARGCAWSCVAARGRAWLRVAYLTPCGRDLINHYDSYCSS